MMTSQYDDKSVQTDPCLKMTSSKFVKTLKIYLCVVNQYRLHLFNEYTQCDESHNNEKLLNVRRRILDRFEWVIIELEQIIENLQRGELTVIDAQQRIDRPRFKEVIDMSLDSEICSIHNLKQSPSNTDELQLHKRGLQEAREDLYVLDLFIHRGISKIDQFVNSPSFAT